MTKNILCRVSILILPFLFLLSCKKELNKDAELPLVAAAKPSPGGGTSLTTVSLAVTVSNTTPDGSPSNITSDGKGEYLNGIDYVQAVLDGAGTFAFNTCNTTSRKIVAKRWVTYNFNNPVDPYNSYRPSPSNAKNYHFSTGSSQFGSQPFIAIQNLGINGNPVSQCIYMGNSIENNTTTWRVSFHKGIEDNATSPTAFAVVTRSKAKAWGDATDEWVIQPVGSCSPNSNVAALRNVDGTVLHGYYFIPFYFTLRAR